MLVVSLFLILVSVVSPVMAGQSLGSQLTLPSYKLGEPIMLRFAYDGQIEDWDAGLNFGATEDGPLVHLANQGVFVVSVGIGPFKSRVVSSRNTYMGWELLEAPRGRVVEPYNVRSGLADAYMVKVNQPFDFTVDMTEYYKIQERGVYTVLWGCGPNHLVECLFQVE